MVHWLREKGYPVGPTRIRRLFRLMGHETIYRRKNLTKGALKAFIRPYLLRGIQITRVNQVWCTDITYIPMAKWFIYMTAIMDVYSRKILSWSISNIMSKKWCLEVLEDAIRQYGKPDIVNSDQGSRYTSPAWTGYLEQAGIKESMDGKGRATDNAFIEHFWKILKYNHIYLNPCDTGLELFEGVQAHIAYHHEKRHQILGMSPNKMYEKSTARFAA